MATYSNLTKFLTSCWKGKKLTQRKVSGIVNEVRYWSKYQGDNIEIELENEFVFRLSFDDPMEIEEVENNSAEDTRDYMNNSYYCLRCQSDVFWYDGPHCMCENSPSPWALKPKSV